MKPSDHEKALLVCRIDAHRKMLGLEVRAVRMVFDPMASALSLLGVDRSLSVSISATLKALRAAVEAITARNSPTTQDERAP